MGRTRLDERGGVHLRMYLAVSPSGCRMVLLQLPPRFSPGLLIATDLAPSMCERLRERVIDEKVTNTVV